MTVVSRDGHDISGTTANRPTNLEPGMTYFDTTTNQLFVANSSGTLVPSPGSTAGPYSALTMTGLITEASAGGLTAVGTNQAGALALTKQINNISTSSAATAPFNGVVLPAAAAGLEIEIINSSANPIQVYGAGTDTINGVAAGTGITMVPGSVVEFSATATGAWFSEGVGIGYSGSFPTVLGVDNLTAVGTNQAGALALIGSINRITTATATAAPFNGVRLPPSAPGLSITIENSAANIVQVYGAGTDTINGIATATGVGHGVGIVATYCCTTAGNWIVQFTVPSQAGIITLSGTADAISPHHAHTYVVTKAGVDAMTLAAPTATTDDGIEITITSNTANAHTLTATGLLQTGTASVNVATFAAQKGAGLTLMAYQGKWNVLASVGITFS